MARAIQIRAPGSPNSSTENSLPPKSISTPGQAKKTETKLCRNIKIFGSCKYQDKGCIYNHDVEGQQNKSTPATPAITLASNLTVQSAVNAPVFVPKSSTPSNSNVNIGPPTTLADDGSIFGEGGPKVFVPRATNGYHPQEEPRDFMMNELPDFFDQSLDMGPYGHLPNHSFEPFTPGGHPSGVLQPPDLLSQPPPFGNFDQSNGGMSGPPMDPFYQAGIPRGIEGSHTPRQPLHYHLYAPPLPHASAHHPHQMAMNAFFMSPNLREELQRKNEAIWQGLGPGEGAEVGGFWGLLPLDSPSEWIGKDGNKDPSAGFFGYTSRVYKAGCEADGKCYVLRRLEGFRLANEAALGMVEKWRRIRHPNIVTVREAFTTRFFGDQSILFVYDYHPLSTTLLEAHLTPKPPVMRPNGRMQPQNVQVPERVLWTYIIQIANAIKAVHTAGLAVRTINPSKVLLTGKNRLRINCCSMLDVIRNDEQLLPNLLQEDLFDFGKLVISLACNSLSSVQNLPRSLEHVGRQYSPDVQKLLLFLFSKPSPRKNVDEVFNIAGSRLLEELNAAENHDDLLESELMREVENGRLVRLLCKFGFINERPEFDHDPRWSETGDRYIIKLFRDYVFHQVDERGRPVVDLSHVLSCLNKLDAGIDERVTLVSRDSQSCLVVSYREIKNCVETAFQSLAR